MSRLAQGTTAARQRRASQDANAAREEEDEDEDEEELLDDEQDLDDANHDIAWEATAEGVEETEEVSLEDDRWSWRGIRVKALEELRDDILHSRVVPQTRLESVVGGGYAINVSRISKRRVRDMIDGRHPLMGVDGPTRGRNLRMARRSLYVDRDRVAALQRADWTVADVRDHVVAPEARRSHLPYVEKHREVSGEPFDAIHVLHPSWLRFDDLVTALLEYCAAKGLDPAAQCVWLETFCLDHGRLHMPLAHVSAEGLHFNCQILPRAMKQFDSVVIALSSNLQGMLSGQVLWGLYALGTGAETVQEVDFAVPNCSTPAAWDDRLAYMLMAPTHTWKTAYRHPEYCFEPAGTMYVSAAHREASAPLLHQAYQEAGQSHVLKVIRQALKSAYTTVLHEFAERRVSAATRPNNMVGILKETANFFRMLELHEDALRYLEFALEECKTDGRDDGELARLHHEIGHSLEQLKRYEDALGAFERALEVARAQENLAYERFMEILGFARCTTSLMLLLGREDAATGLIEDLARFADSVDSTRNASIRNALLTTRADVAIEMYDFDTAYALRKQLATPAGEGPMSSVGDDARINLLRAAAKVLSDAELRAFAEELSSREVGFFNTLRWFTVVTLLENQRCMDLACSLLKDMLDNMPMPIHFRSVILVLHGTAQMLVGRFLEARASLEEAQEAQTARHGLPSDDGSNAQLGLAIVEERFGEIERAIALSREASAKTLEAKGPEATPYLNTREVLAMLELTRGSEEDAVQLLADYERLASESLAVGRELESNILWVKTQLALSGSDPLRTLELCVQNYELKRKRLGYFHPSHVEAGLLVAQRLVALDRIAEAESWVDKLPRPDPLPDGTPPQLGVAESFRHTETIILHYRGRFDEALVLARESLDLHVLVNGSAAIGTIMAHVMLAALLFDMKELDEALALMDLAVGSMEVKEGPSRVVLADLLSMRGRLLAGHGRGDEALRDVEEAARLLPEFDEDSTMQQRFRVSSLHHCFGCAFGAQGDLEAARTSLVKAVLLKSQEYGPDSSMVADVLYDLADATGDRAAAEEAFRIRTLRLGPESPHTALSREQVERLSED